MFTVAPLIEVPPMAMNVTTLEDIILTCTASGYPAPSISWTHNGTTVDESISQISITEQNGERMVMSTLIVTGALTNDSGEYECFATSPIVSFQIVNSGPVTVLAQGKHQFSFYSRAQPHYISLPTDTPEQPQNVTGMALNSTAIMLNWFEPHDNNAPILGYRVMYTRPEFLDGSDVELGVTSEMAVVTGLSPGVTYNFTVIAFNEIGDSRESAVAMVATEEEGALIYDRG